MSLTASKIMLGDMILSRIITLSNILKRVPDMNQEQVDVTTKQNEELLAKEMAIMDSQ